MAKFQVKPIINDGRVRTHRLGAGTGANWTDKEREKFLKLVAESRFDLAAVGDEIEGWLSSVNVATADGYSLGGVASGAYKDVTFDGSQAAGTGAIAINDYVVVGTVVAKDTALSGPPRVRKATDQAAAKASPFAHRVVSLGSAGTGAVGTTGVIEPVNGR